MEVSRESDLWVDGLPVEVFWDVHNWLFGTDFGSAIFMFHTCLSAEKLWDSQLFWILGLVRGVIGSLNCQVLVSH